MKNFSQKFFISKIPEKIFRHIMKTYEWQLFIIYYFFIPSHSERVFYILQALYEFVTEKQVSALNGIYSDLTISVMNQAMSMDEAWWQELFLQNIIRIRGEEYLIELLRNSETRTKLAWTTEWRNHWTFANLHMLPQCMDKRLVVHGQWTNKSDE